VWRSDGYPASLPYTSRSSFWAALCDIGLGGSFINNGTYAVMWDGLGDVGFALSAATVLSNFTNKKIVSIHIGGNSGLNVR
jgi:hypothetical protein